MRTHQLINVWCFIDSRSWITKKLKGLADGNEKDDSVPSTSPTKLLNTSFSSSESNNKMKVSGNYDPRDGYLFKALNLIENEVFYRDSSCASAEPQYGIVQNTLVYLTHYQ